MSKAVSQCQTHGREVSDLWWAGSDSWGQDRSRPRGSGITQHLHYCSETSLLLCLHECESLRHSTSQIFLVYSPFLSPFPPPFPNFVFPLQRRVGSFPRARRKDCFSVQNPALPEQLLGNRSTVTHIAVRDNTINWSPVLLFCYGISFPLDA